MKTAQTKDHYRELLRQMSNDIRPHASAVEEQTCLPTGGQSDGGLSNAPMHLADLGTDASMQETNGIVLDNERYLLKEIDAALGRLDKGQFGCCETCGMPISEERLEAIPYARNCIRCAQDLDGDSPSMMVSEYAEFDDPFARDEKLIDHPDFGGEEPVSFSGRTSDADKDDQPDIHAAGTAGGGTAIGGLAGTNIGRGNPRGGDLERATGSGEFDVDDGVKARDISPASGRAGGAIGGTPAGKRTSGNKDHSAKQESRKPR